MAEKELGRVKGSAVGRNTAYNVGTIDKGNPDIRFSANGTAEVAALEAQNNKKEPPRFLGR